MSYIDISGNKKDMQLFLSELESKSHIEIDMIQTQVKDDRISSQISYIADKRVSNVILFTTTDQTVEIPLLDVRCIELLEDQKIIFGKSFDIFSGKSANIV